MAEKPPNPDHDDRDVINICDGDVDGITQVGHIGDGSSRRGGSVTNIVRGRARNVIQTGDIHGDIRL